MEGIITGLTTAFTGISTEVMKAIAVIVPIGIGIYSVGIVVTYVKKFFGKVAK